MQRLDPRTEGMFPPSLKDLASQEAFDIHYTVGIHLAKCLHTKAIKTEILEICAKHMPGFLRVYVSFLKGINTTKPSVFNHKDQRLLYVEGEEGQYAPATFYGCPTRFVEQFLDSACREPYTAPQVSALLQKDDVRYYIDYDSELDESYLEIPDPFIRGFIGNESNVT